MFNIDLALDLFINNWILFIFVQILMSVPNYYLLRVFSGDFKWYGKSHPGWKNSDGRMEIIFWSIIGGLFLLPFLFLIHIFCFLIKLFKFIYYKFLKKTIFKKITEIIDFIYR